MEQLLVFVGLTVLGVAVGAYGTLVGLGGGFVLMPIFLLFYSNRPPDELTAISLVVVMANAISGAVAYGRMRRIDYRSGIWFAVATIPGAIIGASATEHINRRTFDLVFGAALFLVAMFLLVYRRPPGPRRRPDGWLVVHRDFVEAGGLRHEYSYSMPVALALALGVGFLSSLLGVGGGIVHVPAMVHLLGFPVHVATATSVFVLVWTTMAGTATHLVRHDLDKAMGLVLPLSLGVVVGAQIGARLSKRIHGRWIIIALAVSLAFVGVRIFVKGL